MKKKKDVVRKDMEITNKNSKSYIRPLENSKSTFAGFLFSKA